MVDITLEKAYQTTLRRNAAIERAGYKLVVGSRSAPVLGGTNIYHERGIRVFHMQLYLILNHFKDPSKRSVATPDLVFEKEHVLVSVSLADTLNREPEHIAS